MKKRKIDNKITKYEFGFSKLKNKKRVNGILEDAYNSCRIGTYGGLNTDIVFEDLKRKGYSLKREEICPTADDDIGLRMPNFWPINQGKDAMSIATYYNWMQMKETMKKENILDWNKKVRENFGWIGMVEIQDTSKLVKRLKQENIDFFSTPFTLTECARYLEGHKSKRLNFYKEFSEKIRKWAKNQPFYDASEWNLGKEKSGYIYEKLGRPSNVKLCVKKFWENELLNKRYVPSDRELNIVSRDFSNARNPKAVLLGEDFLELEGEFAKYDPKIHNLLEWFSKSEDLWHRIPVKKKASEEKQEKNAELLREKYPESEIILLSFDPKMQRPFQLSKNDLKKEDTNLEVVLASMAYLDKLGEKDYVEKLKKELE